MKVNLLLNSPKDIRSGYLNLDPLAPPDDPHGRIRCEPNNLDSYVDNNECEEIVALDILDRFQNNEVNGLLDHWLGKLAHGGTITISTIDLREVSRGIISGTLSLDQANELIYGNQLHLGEFKKVGLTVAYLSDLLQSKGLHVLKKRVSNYRAVVTARRN